MNAKIAKKQEVEGFLADFKTAMEYGHFYFVEREKNIQGLIDLGLTLYQSKEIISQLSVDNYVSGPETDDADTSKEVWKFGYELEGKEIYIKLRLASVKGKKHVQLAKVLSFHIAKYSLIYPLQKG